MCLLRSKYTIFFLFRQCLLCKLLQKGVEKDTFLHVLAQCVRILETFVFLSGFLRNVWIKNAQKVHTESVKIGKAAVTAPLQRLTFGGLQYDIFKINN